MMRIDCPHCGARPEHEFHYGGQGHVRRPPVDCDDAAWGTYLFGRDNPKGANAERWRHTDGCGRWFNVVRDTVTHEIAAVYPVTDPRPERSAS